MNKYAVLIIGIISFSLLFSFMPEDNSFTSIIMGLFLPILATFLFYKWIKWADKSELKKHKEAMEKIIK